MWKGSYSISLVHLTYIQNTWIGMFVTFLKYDCMYNLLTHNKPSTAWRYWKENQESYLLEFSNYLFWIMQTEEIGLMIHFCYILRHFTKLNDITDYIVVVCSRDFLPCSRKCGWSFYISGTVNVSVSSLGNRTIKYPTTESLV